MVKKREVKKVVKKVIEEEPKVVKKEIKETNPIIIKRNALIEEIKDKLLSKSQLKRGGSAIRSAHSRESGFVSVIGEINELGSRIGIRPIGLGHLRRN